MSRHCARPGCTAVATATFTFDARAQTVWLDAPADGAARAGELCERHAGRLVAPRGWRVDDRRDARRRPDDAIRSSVFDVRTPLLARAFQSSGTG